MPRVNTPSLWIAIVACLLSCYFSAVNSAMRSFNRKRLAQMLQARGRADRFEPFLEQLPRIILAAATGRVFFSLLMILATLYTVEVSVPDGWPKGAPYAIAFAIAIAALSIFVVAIPLSWARYACERLVTVSIPLFTVLARLMWIIVAPLAVFDPIVRRISGADLNRADLDEELTDELLAVVEEHQIERDVGEDQKEMLEAIVEFPSTTVGEIMTPRTDVEGIEAPATLEEIRAFILEAGHSRYPVYRENLDDIVGILYAKDLLRFLKSDEPFVLEEVVRAPMMVPDTKSVRELLEEFKTAKVHMAIVVDEYGGTAGLITVEDIVEEIVGEIHDEYEPNEEVPAIRLSERTAEVDARVPIDELDDELGVPVPDDADYDTVGGFVFSRLGHIPTVGEKFIFENFAFTVTECERTCVKRVLVEQLEDAAAAPTRNGNGR